MRDGRQTEDMFVSEANRAPSPTAEKSRMVDRLFVLDGLFDIPSCTIPPIDTLTDTVFEYSILGNLLLVSTLSKISVIASLNCLPLRHCLPLGYKV